MQIWFQFARKMNYKTSIIDNAFYNCIQQEIKQDAHGEREENLCQDCRILIILFDYKD